MKLKPVSVLTLIAFSVSFFWLQVFEVGSLGAIWMAGHTVSNVTLIVMAINTWRA